MNDETGSIPDGEAFDPAPEDLEWVLALEIVWAKEEWRRVGEVAIFNRPGLIFSFGRGAESPAGHRRLRWMQQRPFENAWTPPLVSSATSRDQLLVVARDGELELQNVGKYPMVVDGREVERHTARVGDLLQIRGQFLFLVTRRPLRMGPRRHFAERFCRPFGEPNAFDMIGESVPMWELLDHLAFVARLYGHVLLRGATGTGKESAARAIHVMSLHASGPYVTISAGNIPETLIESELFGHKKGATHSKMDFKPGVVGEADGGTLFIDEIARLSREAQVALLRVLDSGEYRNLGGDKVLTSKFKLVAALNREPERLLRDLLGRMPHDVCLPSLAKRREDIPLVLRHRLAKTYAAAPDLLEPFVTQQVDGSRDVVPPVEFVERLMRTEEFEGNFRDLDAAVLELARTSPLRRSADPSHGGGAGIAADGDSPEGEEESASAQLTAERIEWLLARTRGNASAAAKLAGISRSALYRAMDRCGVKRKREG